MNAGTLSAIIKGTRPIAMAQLDLITRGMNLEEGHFYETYGAECFVESAPHWRRLEPFLQRCAELDKLDCIQRVIQQVTDDRSYISELFEMAEGMLERGQQQAARMLYECVAECEKYQHSERLALCQYRIFTLSLGQNQHDNLRAAVHFEPYINRLDEERQLDAIKDLANTYLALRYWDKSFSLADDLGRKAEIIQSYTKKKISKENRVTAYPLFVYQAYSNLLKATACEWKGEYTEALLYTRKNAELASVLNSSDEDKVYIDMFNRWTEANTYLYNLMMGKKEVLPVYLAWVEQNEGETLTALVKIIEAANHFEMDIDHILLKFDNSINSILSDKTLTEGYNEQIKNDQCSKLLFELAMYLFNRERYTEGMQKLVTCLSSAIRINNSDDIIQCVALFERYRSFASKEMVNNYCNLMEEVSRYYEIKKNRGYTLV
ncbi:transcriptional regulator [Paenibacillus sp. JJ-100]|uniref:transcriptional regulator n=1 Tax=Paenibacillus sp. JJ-100 TaxID=2974896 RepID=UPI00233037B1|nr:transcriptional regulator [Paenibacillus sp. JJ-100]